MTPRLLAGAALLAAIAPGLRAQSQAVTFGKPSGPKFEVVSVKPAPAPQTVFSAGQTPHVGIKIDGGRVDIGYWSIKQLIMRAYGLQPYELSGPEWMGSLRFNVLARFPEGATRDQLPDMLQWLLVERFGLVAHGETRSMPALALVVGKGGPKMKPAAADAGGPAGANHIRTVRDILDALMGADPGPLGAIAVSASGGGLHMEFAKMPMDALAMVIAAYLRGPVLDMTGLAGEYQVTLDFSRDDLNAATAPDAPGTAAEPSGASVYSSVQQLGLRLERRKAPVALLVVDRVERVPKEN